MKDLVQSEPVTYVLSRTADWIGKASFAAAWGVKIFTFIGVSLVNDSLTVVLTSVSIIYMGIKVFNEHQIYRKNKNK